jgi:hypothetical protein
VVRRKIVLMNHKVSGQIMVLLSMAFGLIVALLAMLDSSATGTFAAIGAMVLGLGWVARAFFARKS